MTPKIKKEAGFEEQMQQLERLIEKLEGENLSLEDSLATFEQAFNLAKNCGLRLKEARARISVLIEGREEALSFKDDSGRANETLDEDN